MKNIFPVKTVFLVFFIAGVFSLWAPFSSRQSVFAQTLSPDAQEAFDSGVVALEQGSFESAIQYLTRANDAAPTSPKVLYSLGFAYAQAGHEVLAVVFYRSYLEARPEAPNSEELKHDILKLQGSVESIVQKLFKEAIAAADDLVGDDAKAKARQEIIVEMARAGELDWAEKVAFQDPSGATWALARAATEEGLSGFNLFEAKQIFELAEEVIKVEMERYARNAIMPELRACVAGDIECLEELRNEKLQWERDWKERVDYYLGYNLIYLGAYIHDARFQSWGYETKERGLRRMEGCRVKWWFGHCEFSNVSYTCEAEEDFWIILNWFKGGGSLTVGKASSARPFDWNPLGVVEVQPTSVPYLSWKSIARGYTGRDGRALSPFHLNDDVLTDLPFVVSTIKGDAINEIPGRLAQVARKLALAVQFLQENKADIP